MYAIRSYYVSASIPALVTCQLGLNSPRYLTLPNILKAKKKEMVTIPVAELHKEAELGETIAP